MVDEIKIILILCSLSFLPSPFSPSVSQPRSFLSLFAGGTAFIIGWLLLAFAK